MFSVNNFTIGVKDGQRLIESIRLVVNFNFTLSTIEKVKLTGKTVLNIDTFQ